MRKGHKKGHGKHGDTTYFHPFEVAFCGYSGSGKTTLIAKLLDHFAPARSIGYVKHDAHKFVMDTPGKDTHTAAAHGAAGVFISDKTHFAKIDRRLPDFFDRRAAFIDCDWVFIEGFKEQPAPKIIVLDAEAAIVPDVAAGKFVNVVAYVGPQAAFTPADGKPYFHRDDVDAIALFIEMELFKRAAPLRGLVLVGGKSTRMGRDKWALTYHERSQAEHAAALLKTVCSEVVISARDEQDLPDLGLPVYRDRLLGVGPLGGIATAFLEQPKSAWLVVACDLPHLDAAAVAALVAARDPFKIATAYATAPGEPPEPLCAIYEPKSASRLLQQLGFGADCPRKVLLRSQPKLVVPADPRALANVNTPDEYEKARSALRGEHA
jgi:molybdopterin-guanine dinucleotide biosynthesis protein A